MLLWLIDDGDDENDDDQLQRLTQGAKMKRVEC